MEGPSGLRPLRLGFWERGGTGGGTSEERAVMGWVPALTGWATREGEPGWLDFHAGCRVRAANMHAPRPS